MITATYGHGTHNDFIVIFDPQDLITLSPDQIIRLCDRTSGIGADGVIKIIKRSDKWFMDYRNSDGSLAEMCGNGIRVMAKFLVDRGHQGEGIFPIATRDGNKFLKVPQNGDISVNMGQVSYIPGEISAEQNGQIFKGLNIDVGNPHAVLFVESLDQVGPLDHPPLVSPDDEYPEGVNVEFVEFLENGEINMRVHERGSGETQSCGTGTCAVALAATIKKNKKLPIQWVINPPGGRLVVDIDSHNNATLTGPAELIRDIDISKFLQGSSANQI
jgi:diaminopimelate epimerase